MLRRLFQPLPAMFAGGFWLLVLGGLAGCTDRGRLNTAVEVDDPDFRRGQQFVRDGRNQEAVVAFQNVIAKRGTDAPESHLELGLLYLQHIKDPLTAIYHFNEYVRLRPNSPQASLVKQRIDTARREFARTLPAQPLDSPFERLDLLAALDRLKQENEALKAQIAALKSGRSFAADAATARTDIALAGAAPAPESPSSPVAFQIDGIPTVRTRPVTTSRPAVAAPVVAPNAGAALRRDEPRSKPAPAISSQSPATKPPAGRIHTVGQGDTLMSLAQRYYGNRSKWRDILAANKDQLAGENAPLKIGMKLKIP